MRTILDSAPFGTLSAEPLTNARGTWPARWVCCPEETPPPFASAYRCRFRLERAATVRLHVSADERYELFLDGRRVGRGPERGDAANWFFETYDLALAAGEHRLVAQVWSLGTLAPHAQISVRSPFIFAPAGDQTPSEQAVTGSYMRSAFILAPDDPALVARLATGVTAWEVKVLAGITFINPGLAWGTGAKQIIDGARFPWGFERGAGDGWRPVTALNHGASSIQYVGVVPTHLLTPATLPAMIEVERLVGKVKHVSRVASPETRALAVGRQDDLPAEHAAWQVLLAGQQPLDIPAHTQRRIIVDLENYYCAYPELVVSGGAGSLVRVHWSEALFDDEPATRKGNRGATEGKYFVGVGDTFRPDGGRGRMFTTLWWEAGRYLEIVVQTEAEPLRLDGFRLRETRYPLEWEGALEFDDPRVNEMIPIMVRSLQMCAHETYLDCPYYEQMMYVGDTRLQALLTGLMTRDDRLPRKALLLFDASRDPAGLPKARYPSWVSQIIPPFALWHVAMVHDFALWRGDQTFVRPRMRGVRGVIDHFADLVGADGLVQPSAGWFFMDHVPQWKLGVPPPGEDGVSGMINWQFVYALHRAAELEEWLGEPELAARARRMARRQAATTHQAFWDERRGLYADDLEQRHFSEHTQCLAVLSGELDPQRRAPVVAALLADPTLTRATIFFMYYLFETFAAAGRIDALFERLGLWHGLKQQGFVTTPEMPEPSRSDCHGWGAHPLAHFYTSVLGIRPGSMGFATVQIAPQLGPLQSAKGKMAHPNGWIEVDFRVKTGALTGSVTLPNQVSGTFSFADRHQLLRPGHNPI